MRQAEIFLIITTLMLTPNSVYAWGYKGYGVIARIAASERIG